MSEFVHITGEVAVRFQRDGEWYVAGNRGALNMWRVHANSERAVDLLHRLSAHLDPVVDVVVDDERDAEQWEGALRFLPDVREAIGRLRWPLASYGGVEITLVTPDDQLSLMPSLELFIYSRHETWASRLEAEGVRARSSAPAPVWSPMDVPPRDAPELREALLTLAERLELNMSNT